MRYRVGATGERMAKKLILALLLGLAGCGGGGDDGGSSSSTPLQLFRNCLYEWPLPGVPGGSPVYRCYYTSTCKSTDVCNHIPPHLLPAACPYLANECVACPQGQPLSQC